MSCVVFPYRASLHCRGHPLGADHLQSSRNQGARPLVPRLDLHRRVRLRFHAPHGRMKNHPVDDHLHDANRPIPRARSRVRPLRLLREDLLSGQDNVTATRKGNRLPFPCRREDERRSR